MFDAAVRVDRPHRLQIGREQRRRLRVEIGASISLPMPPCHSPVFCASARGQIVEADAGMGVDDAKRLVLLLQILDQPRQHDMLDDVGEISGMIGVTIIHAQRPCRRPCPSAAAAVASSGCPAGRRSPRRNASTRPMKPTAISEKPIGCARWSIVAGAASAARDRPALIWMPSASPGPTVNDVGAVADRRRSRPASSRKILSGSCGLISRGCRIAAELQRRGKHRAGRHARRSASAPCAVAKTDAVGIGRSGRPARAPARRAALSGPSTGLNRPCS